MHYRLVPVAGLVLVRMMEEGRQSHVRCINGLPSGTRFVEARIAWDQPPQVLLLVEHESFDRLREGDVIPLHPPPIFEQV